MHQSVFVVLQEINAVAEAASWCSAPRSIGNNNKIKMRTILMANVITIYILYTEESAAYTDNLYKQ